MKGEPEVCPCGGILIERVQKTIRIDPRTKKMGTIDWRVRPEVSVKKCRKCGYEELGGNGDAILGEIDAVIQKVRLMTDVMDVIRAGDHDIRVYDVHRSLFPFPVESFSRLPRTGDSVLARMMRKKDELTQDLSPGLLDMSKDMEYLKLVHRLRVLTLHLSKNPDDESVEDLVIVTLNQLRATCFTFVQRC